MALWRMNNMRPFRNKFCHNCWPVSWQDGEKKKKKNLGNYFWCLNISQPPRASHWCTQKAHILTSSISQADMKCSHPPRRWEYLAGLILCSMWCRPSHFFLPLPPVKSVSWLGKSGSKNAVFKILLWQKWFHYRTETNKKKKHGPVIATV